MLQVGSGHYIRLHSGRVPGGFKDNVLHYVAPLFNPGNRICKDVFKICLVVGRLCLWNMKASFFVLHCFCTKVVPDSL